CHAAIIARELGIPAVVGCGDATLRIREGQEVTVSCAEGDTGHVYEGLLQFERKQIELEALPKIPVKIMMNVGNPERAFEYANLIGGSRYEPQEENPMLGFRGAARYVDETFRPCFELECQALKRVRETMGLTNVQVMVPFVRSVAEARQVTALLAQNGLQRG